MKETDGSARAARYEANPAEEPEFKTACMMNMGDESHTCSSGTGDD